MIYTDYRQTVDVRNALSVTAKFPPCMVGDTGRRWSLTVSDGGRAIDLTGCTVTGYATRPDGASVSMAAEISEGGEVTIAIPQNALAFPGWLRLHAVVMDGADRLCVADATVQALPAESGEIVNPGTVYPGYDTLSDAVATMQVAIASLPHIYYAETAEAMAAITGMVEGDLCFVPTAE